MDVADMDGNNATPRFATPSYAGATFETTSCNAAQRVTLDEVASPS